MDPLLSQDELGALREVGEAGMTEPIEVYRPKLVEHFDPVYGYAPEYDPQYDYGDDEVSSSLGAESYPGGPWDPGDGPIATTSVWIVSTPLTKDVDNAPDGMIGVPQQLTIRFPFGNVDIQSRDVVKVVSSGRQYTVVDVNDDDTWAAWGKASLVWRQ